MFRKGTSGILLFCVLFLGSLISRVWLMLRYMTLKSDRCFQILAAKNLDEGNGYTLSVQNAGDYIETVYRPLFGWPPAYSVSVSMLNNITKDYLNAAILLDIISVIVFYAAVLLFVWWNRDTLNNWLITLLLIFFGVSLAPFDGVHSTDFFALSFYILAVITFLRWFKTDQKNHLLIILSVIFALLPAVMRYGYYAMYMAFPSFLMVMAVLHKKRKYAIQSVVLGIVFGLFVGGYTYYQYKLTGVANPMPQGRHLNENGVLYFSNLKFTDAFLYNSLMEDAFIVNRLEGVSMALYVSFKYLVTLLIFSSIVYTVVKSIRVKKTDAFNVMVLLVILINVAYLMLVSVKNIVDTNSDQTWFWTYVKEYRYYAPAFIMAILFIFYNYKIIAGYRLNIAKYVVVPLMLIGVLYSVYAVAAGNEMGTFKRNYGSFFTKLDKLRKHSPEGKLVVVNDWDRPVDNASYGSLIQLYDYKVYHDFGEGVLVRTLFGDTSFVSNNHFNKFWDHSSQLSAFDTVYYIGEESSLRNANMTPEMNISSGAIPGVVTITQ